MNKRLLGAFCLVALVSINDSFASPKINLSNLQPGATEGQGSTLPKAGKKKGKNTKSQSRAPEAGRGQEIAASIELSAEVEQKPGQHSLGGETPVATTPAPVLSNVMPASAVAATATVTPEKTPSRSSSPEPSSTTQAAPVTPQASTPQPEPEQQAEPTEATTVSAEQETDSVAEEEGLRNPEQHPKAPELSPEQEDRSSTPTAPAAEQVVGETKRESVTDSSQSSGPGSAAVQVGGPCEDLEAGLAQLAAKNAAASPAANSAAEQETRDKEATGSPTGTAAAPQGVSSTPPAPSTPPAAAQVGGPCEDLEAKLAANNAAVVAEELAANDASMRESEATGRPSTPTNAKGQAAVAGTDLFTRFSGTVALSGIAFAAGSLYGAFDYAKELFVEFNSKALSQWRVLGAIVSTVRAELYRTDSAVQDVVEECVQSKESFENSFAASYVKKLLANAKDQDEVENVLAHLDREAGMAAFMKAYKTHLGLRAGAFAGVALISGTIATFAFLRYRKSNPKI